MVIAPRVGGSEYYLGRSMSKLSGGLEMFNTYFNRGLGYTDVNICQIIKWYTPNNFTFYYI